MCVQAEHLPVFVARNEGDLLDGKTGFEESPCALVPEIVKVKVVVLRARHWRRKAVSTDRPLPAISASIVAAGLELDCRPWRR
jgi:hypothetical protein